MRRLLVLSHRVPFPPHNGAALRTYNVLRLLARDFAITALCFDRRDRATPLSLEDRLQALNAFGHFEAFTIPQERHRRRFVLDHAWSIATRRPYTWYLYDSRPFGSRLEALLNGGDFDLVHVDSLDVMRFLPALHSLPVVCTHHNVESLFLRRRAASLRWPVSSYLRMQANAIERAERAWLPRVALNIAVSPQDAVVFQRLAPGARVAVIPNAVDIDHFAPRVEPERGCVFVGGTSGYPNRDALDWFTSDILPRLRARDPSIEVTWVGRATDAERQHFGAMPGLRMTGYVDDVRPYLAAAACVIAPLRVGGGTRFKILDAWAMGKAVVSTAIGAEGLDARHGENILLADSADDFATAVMTVLTDEGQRRALEAAARRTVEDRYSWDVVGSAMRALYSEIAVSIARATAGQL